MKDIHSDSPSSSVMACITTMNRPDMLKACLAHLGRCVPTPHSIVVSDDSSDPAVIVINRALVADVANALYVGGPRRGVCANRNNALMHAAAEGGEYVFFIDDDLHVPELFFHNVQSIYASLPEAERQTTICTGYRDDCADGPVRLTFRGYFTLAPEPGSVTVGAAVFPVRFLRDHGWDENIFFGCEDAELSLRAVAAGYRILFTPSLMSYHLADRKGVLLDVNSGGMSRYELCREAARLYVGAKRYAVIQPSRFKLAAFLVVYFAHMTIYLGRRQSLRSFKDILRLSNLSRVWDMKRAVSLRP